jgi:hypothetical protein
MIQVDASPVVPSAATHPNRSHRTCIEAGREEVADFALDWATKNARAPNVWPMKAA